MDGLTPLYQQARQLSQDGRSASIGVVPHFISSQNNNSTPIISGGSGREKLSANARRLELRNVGFRAALLPARRLSPPNTSITGFAVGRTDKENVDVHVKTRDFLNPSTSPLNILREINNSARRIRSVSPSSLGEIFGFADDEKEAHTVDQSDTMIFKTGSIKSVKNRKRVRRTPSFQSTKYIEYLESELGSTTERLQALQSPETVKGQAAKIRKLEQKVQELSQHVSDWEQNYEERVNDQVFERLHGESNLKLKLRQAEETAASKDAHIVELGKELEDVRIKLGESESVEVTLTRRVDVLTELLARSPTRGSFSASTPLDTPIPPRSVQSMLTRLSTSPIRKSQRFDALDEALQTNHTLESTNNLSESLSYQSDGHLVDTDTDSQDLLSISSRPASGIFSSCSSQTSSSRPASIFSTSSFSISSAVDEKPCGRPRRSRRFAPGATGLKPLLLPTTAALADQGNAFETPKKEQLGIQSGNESSWESAGEMATLTPSRPRIKRPYSWAPSPSVTGHQMILEDVESDGKFGRANDNTDDLPAYLRHLALQPSPGDDFEGAFGDLPSQTTPSLHEELGDERFSEEYIESPHQTGGLQQMSVSALSESNATTLKKAPYEHIAVQDIFGDSSVLRTSLGPSAEQIQEIQNPPSVSQCSCDGLPLERRPLSFVRQILLRSWTRGSSQFGGVAWWILSFFIRPHAAQYSPAQSTSKVRLSHSKTTTAISQKIQNLHTEQLSPPVRIGVAKLFAQLRALVLSGIRTKNKQRCSCCAEPSGSRKLKLWTKLTLALVLAIGYAILEGPGAILEGNCANQPVSDTTLHTAKDEE